jgi:hypothetical protein
MASGFPGSIDNFTDPLTTSALNSPSHAGQHQDLNDAVEKIETYMGLVKVIPTSVSSAGGTAATLAANGTVTIGTGNTSVTVSGAFSSLYDAYKIVISGGTGSVAMDLQLSLTGSSTGYYSGLMYVAYGSIGTVNAQGVGSGNAASWIYAGNGGTSTLGMNVDLNGPYLAKVTGMSGGDVVVNTSGSVAFTSGFHNVATSYTGFTVTASTGTMTGGTIRVYGYRN